MNRVLLDYSPEQEVFAAAAPALAASEVRQLSDLQMTELAVDLLSAANETELDQFLDRLMRRTTRAAGLPVRESVAKRLKQIFRASAVNAMPQAHAAAARYRARFAQGANRFFGLELEGLSPEDQELEIAKSFVRFAHEATRSAAAASGGLPVQTATQLAVARAARKLAPGLLRKLPHTASRPRAAETHSDRLSYRNHQSAQSCANFSQETIMHDIDRTQMELESEAPAFETEEFEYETFNAGEFEEETGESPLSEAEEMELASELLAVGNEAELDQFLGNTIRRFAKKARKVIRSPVGRAIGGLLKGVAKKALPLAGGALGGAIGGPLGAKIGSGFGSLAGKALGLEAEALEQEDLEFEGARQFARLAAETVQKAVAAPAGTDPKAAAQAAVMAAVKKHAPGLIGGARTTNVAVSRQRGRSGRWLRRGNHIVLIGV